MDDEFPFGPDHAGCPMCETWAYLLRADYSSYAGAFPASAEF